MVTPSANSAALTLSHVTGLLLAGGRGSRMGGVDKGLQMLNGVPLAQHALQRLLAQQGGPLGAVRVNANRHIARYQALADQLLDVGSAPVLADSLPDFAGPLAGVAAGLAQCQTPLLLTVPCDSPRFPLDLAQRLLQGLQVSGADLAMVQTRQQVAPGQWQSAKQPVFCLMKVSVAAGLDAFLADGGRKIGAWAAEQTVVVVLFDEADYGPAAFANANTQDDLDGLAARDVGHQQTKNTEHE
ncbi:molybdenum cofactor guanylyltransferase MobA [Acidovorax sp.]|uniref:molybdenum cofactor guanylyltransferase MobA n=1 Tax=Acidovorax sp. TaxID=1872122 RepID=UPI002ACEE748|nr:molybdenum cofactor guanylyltransferase MobA [Acidovorax sp.]MDZ7862262.1 molybdenum cofactor guanylyltransferase MobA [Acidovorax sp.]